MFSLLSGTELQAPGVISCVNSQSLKCEVLSMIFISGVQFGVDNEKGELFSPPTPFPLRFVMYYDQISSGCTIHQNQNLIKIG